MSCIYVYKICIHQTSDADMYLMYFLGCDQAKDEDEEKSAS